MQTKCSEQIGIGHYLSRRLLPLSAGIGLLIAFLAPVTYWFIAHYNHQQNTSHYAEELADKFREMALEAPELWKYQTYKFIKTTEGFHPTLEVLGFSVLDEKGEPITAYQYMRGWKKHGRKLTFTEELRFSLGTAPILFNNRRVGTVEVLISDAPLLRGTAVLFAVSLLVGISLAVLVYQFPVRVVRKAEVEVERLVVAVQESEKKYRSLVGNIPDVIWSCGRDRDISFISANVERVCGYSAEEFHALGPSLWFANVHTDELELVREAFHSLFTRDDVFDVEYRYRRMDGEWIWLHDRAMGTYERDGVRHADGLFTDITDRKRMEEALKESETKFRSLVEESLVGVYIIQDQIFKYLNPKLAEIFGYEAAELLDRKGPVDLVLPDDWPMVEENLRRRQAGEIKSLNYAFRGVTRGHEVIHLEVFGSLTVYHGRPAVIGTMLDVTDRKRAEEALAAQTQELARSNGELEQFAYVASHDLQEPLRMVSSYMQLLARRYKGKLDADADEFIAFAVDGATRMQRLIKDLLMYSRVGTKGKEPVPTDCGAVIGYALDNLQQAIAEKGATVTHDELPTIMGDEVQLTQLFQNLIGNAIKFQGEEPPQVHVGVLREGSGWLFSVRDNGIGIAPEHFERIFQIFQRLHGREEYPGTGIGLSVCQKIVERHGGRIWVDSAPGNGATFCFTVPETRGEKP